MADLLADQLRCTCLVLPLSKEQLAEERVQRLLLAAQLLTSAGILLLQCAQEPPQNESSTLGRVFLGSGSDEDGRVFSPVRGELGKRRCREDEGGRSHGGEVAIKRRDRLEEAGPGALGLRGHSSAFFLSHDACG